MKHLLTLIVLSLSTSLLPAQVIPLDPANGWIHPGQPYYRIVTDAAGVYHITEYDLAAGGCNIAGINLNNLHLIYRGVEVPIHIGVEGINTKFLEFYAPIHDGGDEYFLYRTQMDDLDSTAHANPSMSQTSPHSVYFLTWDNQPGLRYTTYADFNYSGQPIPLCHRHRYEVNFADTLIVQELLTPHNTGTSPVSWRGGEGYAGPVVMQNAPLDWVIPTPHGCPNADSSSLAVRALFNTYTGHQFKITGNGQQLIPIVLSNSYTYSSITQLPANQGDSLQLTFSELDLAKDYLTQIRLDYDRDFDLNGETAGTVMDYTETTPKHLQWRGATATDSVWAYDVENGIRMSGIAAPGSVGMDINVMVPGTNGQRTLHWVTDLGFLSPVKIEAARLHDYSHSTGVEFVVIAPKSLGIAANAFSDYRANRSPHPKTAAVFELESIADEFGFGQSTPLAIKRFAMTALANWATPPRYILLMGRANPDLRDLQDNEVPTWGYPACDMEYVSNFAVYPVDRTPRLAIGRVPARDYLEGLAYLAKVVEYESWNHAPWKQRAAFVAARQPVIGSPFTNDVTGDSIVYNSLVPNGEGPIYLFDSTGPVSSNALTLWQTLSQGLAWVELLERNDSNWTAAYSGMNSPESLINAGMYPVVYCLSDQALAAGKQLTLAERWVMAPGKGAIGFFGPGNSPFSAPWDNFTNAFWPLAWSNPDGLTIGEEIDSVMRSLSSQYSNLTNAIDLIYLGDPAIIVWNPQQPLTAAPPSDPVQGIALYPNPFHESLWLDLTLEKAAPVNLEVLDVSGRSVMSQDCGFLSAAAHHLALDLPTQIASGMYLVRISVGNRCIFKKLVRE